MADTHRKLLADWRERARTSQIEARRVIAEMLIPSGINLKFLKCPAIMFWHNLFYDFSYCFNGL